MFAGGDSSNSVVGGVKNFEERLTSSANSAFNAILRSCYQVHSSTSTSTPATATAIVTLRITAPTTHI